MARYREKPYGLYKRRVRDDLIVYYYTVYDENGKRKYYSTGQTNKRKAEEYCLQLYKNDGLLQEKPALIRDFTVPFFTEECEYIKRREQWNNQKFSSHYVKTMRTRLLAIVEKLDNVPLAKIDSVKIEKALQALSGRYNNKGLNSVLSALSIALEEAVRKKIISSNPCKCVKKMKADSHKRGILTVSEARNLFLIENWRGYEIERVANMLSAVTGMRRGEILALKIEDVHPECIYVHRAYAYGDGIKEKTKTGISRYVPMIDYVYQQIKSICHESGFVFSRTNGMAPLPNWRLNECFVRALEIIGVNEAERKKRNITFHSWRHFFNTYCRTVGVPDSKLQAVTGHLTDAMTEHYTHFKPSDFGEVVRVQETMLQKK